MANISGISALYHNSACCLVQNGELKIAVEEERFTRVKHDSSMPRNAFRYCLEESGISINDIDAVAYYELPDLNLERQKWSGITPETLQQKMNLDFRRPEKLIRNVLGYEGKILYYKHHLSHAASSYLYSDFTDSAILTVDGVGEWETTTYGHGKDGDISIFNDVKFLHSFGLLYATITSFLGFGVNSGEYKVMGLAPYGKPVYADAVRKLFQLEKEGQYKLNLQYFDFIKGKRMYSDKLTNLFGMNPRIPESELKQEHMDLARSLQMVLEEVMLHMADYVYGRTKSENLCLAGGLR